MYITRTHSLTDTHTHTLSLFLSLSLSLSPSLPLQECIQDETKRNARRLGEATGVWKSFFQSFPLMPQLSFPFRRSTSAQVW